MAPVWVEVETKSDAKYEIMAIVANKTVQNELNEYSERVKKTGGYKGFPNGADVHHRITLIGK
ncbi:MAG: hypothetical protein B6244_11190 [Candidatus Cloacimonetes bacterium 4572_55]|nr:MAG: hypothetical protein B6244_11190 [Candidatus Cloacimonetes bacterium 4572_55]